MKNIILLASVGLLSSCTCSHENWRDDCQANYTSESGELTKCQNAANMRKAEKAVRTEPEDTDALPSEDTANNPPASIKKAPPAVGLKSLLLPRLPRDYGRIPQSSNSSTS